MVYTEGIQKWYSDWSMNVQFFLYTRAQNDTPAGLEAHYARNYLIHIKIMSKSSPWSQGRKSAIWKENIQRTLHTKKGEWAVMVHHNQEKGNPHISCGRPSSSPASPVSFSEQIMPSAFRSVPSVYPARGSGFGSSGVLGATHPPRLGFSIHPFLVGTTCAYSRVTCSYY